VNAFAAIFSASSFFFSPSFMEIREVAPSPINIERAIDMSIIGKVTVNPESAREPTPLPIKILSTTLYRALTSIPIIAGIENFTISFSMLSSPKTFE